MRRYLLAAAVTGVATLTGLGWAGGASAAAAPAAAPGTQLWAARFPLGYADAMAVSPGGRRVFVTGWTSVGPRNALEYATAAYSAATGRRLWIHRYSGPRHSDIDGAHAIAVSQDGRRVFVTGIAHGWGTGYDYATVAYSAATGRQLWASRYNGPGNGLDGANAMAVSPGGGKIFVTGISQGRTTGSDFATVAYSTATGRQLWVSRYNGLGTGIDLANSVAVSPGGASVFVTGDSYGGPTTGTDFATVAYSAATGSQLWVSRHNGPANGLDLASSVAVSPGGGSVFVTGSSEAPTTGTDYATVAYGAATGSQLWVSRYSGPLHRADAAAAVAVSPTGTTVFVTGYSQGLTSGDDYATVAYSAATGRQLWVSRYNGPANKYDAASAVAVSPGGATVFVTGQSYTRTGSDYATVAYSAATGRRLWTTRYSGSATEDDAASAVAVSPAGTTVFVTGETTVAYRS